MERGDFIMGDMPKIYAFRPKQGKVTKFATGTGGKLPQERQAQARKAPRSRFSEASGYGKWRPGTRDRFTREQPVPRIGD